MENNKRIINIRSLFLIFIAFGAGIVCIYNFLSAGIFGRFDFSMVIFSLLMLIFFVFTGLYFLERKEKIVSKKFSIYIKNNYKYMLIIIVAFVLGACAGYIQTNKFSLLKNYRFEQCSIIGKVVEIDNGRIVLENVFVKEDNTKLESGCVVYIYDDEKELHFQTSDTIEIKGSLSLQSIYSNQVNISRFLYSNAYQFNMDSDGLVAVTAGRLSFAEKLRQNIFNILSRELNLENASVCMSVLFGVRQDFPYEINEAFSLVGISHILSVSGLHVGVLMAVLLYILNAISKKKTWWHFLIIALIVLFYCYLCDFTFSVLRATIMGLVMLGANLLGKRYDSLSALSLAGILILIFAPLAIFSVGFQLSFLCVFAIITLAPLLTKSFKSIKIPKNLANALAISVSINAVLFPLTANIFNKVSIISVFANIIIIPMFSFVFISLLLFSIIVLLIPFFSFLLIIPNVILHTIKLIATALSKMPFAYINIFHVGYFIVILTILLAFIIKYLMVKDKIKCAISGTLVFIIIIVSVFANFPATSIHNKVFIDYQRSGNYAFVITEKSEVSLIGFNKNTYYINQSMIAHRIKSIKNIIAYDFDLTMLPALLEFVYNNKVECVYFPSFFISSPLLFAKLNNRSNVNFLKGENNVDEFFIKEYNYFSNQTLAVNIKIANKQLLFIKKLKTDEFIYLANNLEEGTNYVIANSINYDYSSYISQFDNVIFHNINKTKAKKYVNLYSLNTFTLHL